MTKMYSIASSVAGFALVLFGSSTVYAADDGAPPGRSIAYALTDLKWAVYESKDAKEECPNGVGVLGPREQFKEQFPDDGTERKLVDTQLAREVDVWWPNTKADPFAFSEASGKTGIGLNLDGKVKPTDFTSPDGKPGIDNQLYRVIGCIRNYRAGSTYYIIEHNYFRKMRINRIMIELTDVDSLVNDDDVTLTTYRGLDDLMYDATGNSYQPGATERLDLRWGKIFIRQTKGKIVGGVLTTQPVDLAFPREVSFQDATTDWLRDGRFEVKLTPERGEGIIGGYADIESIYNNRNRQASSHHASYGQQAQASFYKELRKWADAYPDPDTGENTAISAAYTVKMVQVRALRPDKPIASALAKQFADSSAK